MGNEESETPIVVAADHVPPMVVPVAADEVDRATEVLDSERRQRVVSLLATEGVPTTVSELAQNLAVDETGEPPGSVPSVVVELWRQSLRTDHLPALAECGLLEFDDEAEIVPWVHTGIVVLGE